MKKILFAVLILIICMNMIYAHGQGVHQHMVREAYKLLKSFVGQDIREIKDHVGYNETGNGVFNPGNLLVIGAHREDEEDPVYQNSFPFGWTVTNTHFWDPDRGDGSHFSFLEIVYENAFQKAIKYYYGGYILFIPASNPNAQDRKLHVTTPLGDELIIYPDEPQYGGFYLSYYSLADLFKSCRLKTQLIGKNQMWNVKKRRWEYWNGDVYISHELRDGLVWELLGRICHLLGDMSVPAHVHNDPHPPTDPDSYENWMDQPPIYNQWTYQNAINQGGLINPTSHSNPLKYLFYSTSQITNFFPSDDINGNNSIGVNEPFTSYPGLNEFISSLTSQYGPPPVNTDPIPSNLLNGISNNCFVYAMRAISGLLYMFAKEADLLPQPLTSVMLMGNFTLYAESTGHWWVTLGNGIEPFTYTWQIMYLDGSGYLQSYESVKKEKEKLEKYRDKQKDGDIIIEATPSNEWVPIGTNSPAFSKPHNPYDLRDFKLRCIVKDASNTTKTSNEFYVDVTADLLPMPNVVSNDKKEQSISLAKENEAFTRPVNYSLDQNYPNPFNPTTIINYRVPENSLVTIKVYDVLGKEVAELVNEEKVTGSYSVTFNASNLSSGVYFYTITAGKYSAMKKMLLIK